MSAAALAACPPSSPPRRPRHCPENAYLDFLASSQGHFNRQYLNTKRRYYREFRQRWPNPAEWFVAPLTERVGRLPGEQFRRPSYPISFRARPYLMFLGLRGYATFDYPWMLAVDQLRVGDQAAFLGLDLGTEKLVEEAVALGYHPASARQAMSWSVHRILLRHGLTHVSSINEAHVLEALEAVGQFIDHSAFAVFYPSTEHYRDGAAKTWITHLHQLQVVLFHRGQVSTQPRKLMPAWKPASALPPRMQAVADKWLAARRLTDRPSTVDKLELATRRFGEWLSRHHPEVDSFAQVTREHCLGWIQSLPTSRATPPASRCA